MLTLLISFFTSFIIFRILFSKEEKDITKEIPNPGNMTNTT